MSWRRFNLWRVIVYLVLTTPCYFLGLLRSVTFVSLISIWALVESSFTSWRADVPTEDD